MVREIVLYKTYFTDFYNSQPLPAQGKIDYVLGLIQTEARVPEKFLRHLTDSDGLYEIRIKNGNNIFRIFCFLTPVNL